MGKKHFILFVCLLIVGLMVLEWKPFHLGEPWYHGKSLSGWLEVYGAGPRGYQPAPEADAALRRIGTNAVPGLLCLLHSNRSHTNRKLMTTPPGMPGGVWITMNPPNASLGVRLKMWLGKHAYIGVQRTVAPPSWDHWQAYLGFQALGPLGKPAIPDLVKLARDPSGASFPGNVHDMKNITPVAGLADNSGTYVAADDPPLTGWQGWRRGTNSYLVDGEIAAYSLAAIGPDSVPPLVELLADPNPRLKARAAVALGMIGGAAEPAVPELVRCLTNAELWVRMSAADALGWIGKRPELAVPALTAALNDPDVGVQIWAARSLGMFRERATSAIPALLKSFAITDYRIKGSAAVALSKISRATTADEVVPSLLNRFRDPDWRNSVLCMLGEMRDEPELVIPTLIEAMSDTNRMVQYNAMLSLGEFGPKARAAAPKLASLTNDPDGETRDVAIRALRQVNRRP